ncbi:hypothetical protein GF318_03785 [Candidatus Micrarchaeota archaeon]|nr:hypothetical protein [Candidatus Micrarchaeota archaeon]
MIAEICVGAGILIILVVAVYLIFFSKAFEYRKKTFKGTTSLTVYAKKNLKKVSVKADDISFERKRIRKGQTVEFDFPSTKKPARLIVEEESGHAQTVDV